MKFTAAILLTVALNCSAQVIITKHAPGPNALNETDFTAHTAAILDPYRVINGETQKVDGTWLAVSGRIVQVHPSEGIRVSGGIEGQSMGTDFFVVNLPVSGAEGDYLPPAGCVLLVKDVGTYTYSTAAGSSRTIRKYDYGTPWTPPPLTPEQLAAQRAAQKADLEARKKFAGEKVLARDKAAAANDDADGLERMAERYRDGNGVEKDLIRAQIYFKRAAANGSTTASNKLATLPTK